MRLYSNTYDQIASVGNLFLAWDEFRKDKHNKPDVMKFEWQLEENIFELHRQLVAKSYRHKGYQAFYIQDPKQRLIHKAVVHDRVLHHAVFNILNPIFEPTFIAHSFSCRVDKGTHRGVQSLTTMTRKVSNNYRLPCFSLKCDIQKFFGSVNHETLFAILCRRIQDESTLWLLHQIIYSFNPTSMGKGIPIGNLTSQLFANIYMNEFDQFIKHDLKIKHYVRYTDDFIILGNDRDELQKLLEPVGKFLNKHLHLSLHPHKVSIRKLSQGLDFLGYVVLPNHIVMRTKTRRRIVNKLKQRLEQQNQGKITAEALNQVLQSYLGVLSHADAYRLSEELKNKVWLEHSK